MLMQQRLGRSLPRRPGHFKVIAREGSGAKGSGLLCGDGVAMGWAMPDFGWCYRLLVSWRIGVRFGDVSFVGKIMRAGLLLMGTSEIFVYLLKILDVSR